jgi:ankyrin repeat protein
LARSGNLDIKDATHTSALAHAVDGANLDMVIALVKGGADKHGRHGAFDRNILHEAVVRGLSDIANFLIEEKVHVSTTDLLGKTSLHDGYWPSMEKVYLKLVDKAPSVDVKDNFGRTPIFYVAMHGTLRMLQTLVEMSLIHISEPTRQVR